MNLTRERPAHDIVFPLPETLEQAELLIERLNLDIKSIMIQLEDESRFDYKNNTTMPENEYLSWRRRARVALSIKTAQRRVVVGWIRRNRSESDDQVDDESDLLLINVYDFLSDYLEKLPPDGAAYSSVESCIERIEIYLQKRGILHDEDE